MFGDIGKMLKLAGQMRTKLPELREKMAAARYTGEAGGGAVKAVVDGRGSIIELWIDPAVVADREMDAASLADVVKAAIAAAQEQAVQATAKAMNELTGGMNLPGFDGMPI